MRLLLVLFVFSRLIANGQDVPELLKQLKNTQHDTSKIPILIDLSAICDLNDIPQYANKGLLLVNACIKKEPNSNYHLNQRAELLSNLAYYYGEKSDTLKQDSISTITLAIHTKTGNIRGKASVLNNIGYSYTSRGNYIKAVEYYKKSLILVKRLKDNKAAALRYNNIGDIYLRLGMFNEAIQYMQNALNEYDLVNDIKGQMLVCANLSNANVMQSNLTDAKKYSSRALLLSRKIPYNEYTGTVYHNHGSVLHKLNQFKQALLFLDTALLLKKRYTAEREWISTYSSVANIYEDQKNISKAMVYYDSAFALSSSIQAPPEMASQLMNLARLTIDMGKRQEGILLLEKSFRLAKKINSKVLLAKVSSLLSSTYASTPKKQEALKWLQLYVQYNDSLYNDRSREFAIRTSLAYEQNMQRKKDSLKNVAQIQQLEIKRIDEKARDDKKKQWLFAGIILMLVIAVFLIYGSIRKSKMNKLILLEKQTIEKQKFIIEEQRNEIVDSITYAKRIQRSILPSQTTFTTVFPESFVFYQPKDQLSGDFYYTGKVTTKTNDDLLLFAVADCTGHGVPGALLSIVGIIYLQLGQNMPQINSPAEAIDLLNMGIHRIFTQDEYGQLIRDGMDMVLGAIRKSDLKLFYAAAKNNIYIVRDEKLIELKGDSFAVGRGDNEEPLPFNNYEFQLEKGDMLYALTDGFVDQFGGPNGKKFKHKQLVQLVSKIAHLPAADQKTQMQTAFNNWKGDQDQVDDICVIGIRI